MSDVESIHDLTQALLHRLDARALKVSAREAECRQWLEECLAERQDIDRERRVLLEAEKIYRREIDAGLEMRLLFPDASRPRGVAVFDIDDSAEAATSVSPVGAEPPKLLKARIGPQRYRMLHALRQVRPTGLLAQDIASRTGFTFRRVKDQMLADQELGVVAAESFDPNAFKITDIGLDLLERFETYKRTRGEPLPSLTDPISEDDRDEEADHDFSSPEGASA